MKKYRVSGTGVHAIKLVECALNPKKVTGVTWLESLKEAKVQVLKNQVVEIDRLLEEKKMAVRRLNTIEAYIATVSKPLSLDLITDDYLIGINRSLDELSDQISRGDVDGIF